MSDPTPDPIRIGPYLVERELGRGGQGVVYLAKDTRVGRRVALKVLSRLGPGAESILGRFRREASITSRLDHPGICGVYESAVDGAVPYIAMRYVEGQSLARLIADSQASPEADSDCSIISFDHAEPVPEPAAPTAPRETGTTPNVMRVLRIFEKAARALHAAHEVGVIHRDLKPGNILLTREDEPVILDFGLAMEEDEMGQSLTQSGDLFGTPAYMSPEQLAAQRIGLDRRTDIWSLAVSLFECLTLKRPFDAPTREGTYQAILTRDPPDPRTLHRGLPGDVRVVLETALEKDRNRRYATALAFAEDLRRIRCYEPILARPAGMGVRLRRWVQRNPASAALVGSLLVLLPLASALLSYGLGQGERATLAREKAEAESRLRAQAEETSANLAFADRVRRFRDTTEEGTSRTALLQFVIDGHSAFEEQLDATLSAFDILELPLNGTKTDEQWIQTFEALRERDASVARRVINGLQEVTWFHHRRQIIPEARRGQLAEVVQRAKRLSQQVETDPWYVEFGKVTAGSANPAVLESYVAAAQAGRLTGDKISLVAFTLAMASGGPGPKLDPRSLELMDLALDENPDDFGLRFARGGLQMSIPGPNGEPDAATARRHFEAAVAARPHSAVGWAMLSIIRAADSDLPGARAAASQAVTRAPDDALGWHFQGYLQAIQGDWDNARVSLERALELRPDFSAARDALQRVAEKRQPAPFGPRRP